MKTNDIKKGMRVLLAYGDQRGNPCRVGSFAEWNAIRGNTSFRPWEGEMVDNMKGNTRMVNVHGFETEAGSVYSHDIMAVWHEDGLYWEEVEHTPAQLKLKQQIKDMGF